MAGHTGPGANRPEQVRRAQRGVDMFSGLRVNAVNVPSGGAGVMFTLATPHSVERGGGEVPTAHRAPRSEAVGIHLEESRATVPPQVTRLLMSRVVPSAY